MKKRLKRNICNLNDYTVLSRVGDLSAYQKSHIGGALEYACQFWTKHLVNIPSGGYNVEEVRKAIDDFFITCLLPWIEVLTIVGNLGVGVHAINDIKQWYISVSYEEFFFTKSCTYSLSRRA